MKSEDRNKYLNDVSDFLADVDNTIQDTWDNIFMSSANNAIESACPSYTGMGYVEVENIPYRMENHYVFFKYPMPIVTIDTPRVSDGFHCSPFCYQSEDISILNAILFPDIYGKWVYKEEYVNRFCYVWDFESLKMEAEDMMTNAIVSFMRFNNF